MERARLSFERVVSLRCVVSSTEAVAPIGRALLPAAETAAASACRLAVPRTLACSVATFAVAAVAHGTVWSTRPARDAQVMPSTLLRARSARPTQDAQLMPSTDRLIVVPADFLGRD